MLNSTFVSGQCGDPSGQCGDLSQEFISPDLPGVLISVLVFAHYFPSADRSFVFSAFVFEGGYMHMLFGK